MVKLIIEDGAANQRPQNFRQQKIWNRLELIAGRRMSRHIHAQPAKLLNEPPDFCAVRRNLLRDLRSAHHDRRMLHQQPHEAAETNVGRLFVRRGRLCSRKPGASSFACLLNAVIMREERENHKSSAEQVYANATRRLISDACGE